MFAMVVHKRKHKTMPTIVSSKIALTIKHASIELKAMMMLSGATLMPSIAQLIQITGNATNPTDNVLLLVAEQWMFIRTIK